MKNFEFHNPTQVFFGKGETDRVGECCARFGKRVLLMYGGGSIKRNGLYDRVMRSLQAQGLEVLEVSGIQPNPRIDKVREGVQICKEKGVEVILAVGGGSVLDSAKIVAIGAHYQGDPWDFFLEEKTIPQTKTPLVTVLTLAATGSEMNHNAVVSNDETQEKLAVVNPAIFPDISILDPENTFTVPRDQTVNGIVDILAHVFEQYFQPVPETPLQDRLAESIISTVIEYTPRVLNYPHDYDARATIMWCGTLALNHLLECGGDGDWSTHAIEHELSAFYDIPHGAGLAIIFPQWMQYVIEVIPHKFAQFAERVWKMERKGKDDRELALEAIAKTKSWFSEIGAPVSLKEVGIGTENLERMATHATRKGPLGSVKKLYKEDVLAILKMCL
ncbi:MAG: iron-containing alcohol dehydrogenase [Candidatus Caldatribacteriaceae bacterium]